MTEIKHYRDRSCVLVKQLILSEELLLENILELWSLGNKIYTEAWCTEFHVFGVIASNTEHIPLGEVREKCSTRFLDLADREMQEAAVLYKTDLNEAYGKIIKLHGDT